MRFLDLFSGIGGFRLGMEMAGHKCVGHCEIDKFAEKSYRAIFDIKEDEWFAEDITKVHPDELPPADIWCFGFPCQDISIAGAQQGLDGRRSGLFYTVIDLLKGKKEEDRPSYLLIENVKNLLSINDGWDFARVLFALDEAGYDAEWQVLNSKNFGVPQNRERVFIIGHHRRRRTRKVFPIIPCMDCKNPAVTLTARGYGSQRNGTYVVKDAKIRRLTPRECWRLQGFPDWAFERASKVNSDTQLYKQAGNAVTVPVIYEIAKRF